MTGIEWTDETWNPVVGCSPVSEGCRHCYAARMAHRLAHNPLTGDQYEGLATAQGWTGKIRLLPLRLEQPLRWRKPRRVFVCSMSDWCHESVLYPFRCAMLAVAQAAPQHTYQFLTKRTIGLEDTFGYIWNHTGRRSHLRFLRSEAQCLGLDLGLDDRVAGPWPLPNVWLGTTVESAKHLDRIDHLKACPAAVRFLSCEPLLGSLGPLDLAGIHWVIVGGETGPGARLMRADWARQIRAQCVAAGVAFFFKSHGGNQRKKDRLLDGRRWEEMPT